MNFRTEIRLLIDGITHISANDLEITHDGSELIVNGEPRQSYAVAFEVGSRPILEPAKVHSLKFPFGGGQNADHLDITDDGLQVNLESSMPGIYHNTLKLMLGGRWQRFTVRFDANEKPVAIIQGVL